MPQATTEKFKIRNLDCANCAAKLERHLNEVEGIEYAAIDFANLVLHTRTSDTAKVIAAAAKIDAAVKLIPFKDQVSQDSSFSAADPSYRPKREILLLSLATILFAAELIIENYEVKDTWLFLELPMVLTAYLLVGWNVFVKALKTVYHRTFFDENVLMVIATLGALAIHAYSEAVGVMIFYKVGELLQERAVSRSRRSIQALLATRPNKALVKTPFGYEEKSPEEVAVNASILIKPGEKVPLDGEIIAGSSIIDGSALTGESTPISVKEGDTVMAGQINQSGGLTVRVTQPFSNSSIAKMMDLVENATARKADTEKFITTFARYYTPGVVLIAALIALLPPLFYTGSFENWIYRALVILVISCPCALMISIPLGYFGGIGRASKSGILVKGSNFIDALSDLKTVVFDKTGTLTQGIFQLNRIEVSNGFSQDQVLEFAAAAELHSTHPIAASIRQAFAAAGGQIAADEISNHNEISGEGVLARYQGKSIVVGSDALLHRRQIPHDKCAFDATVIHVAVDGEYAGHLMVGDQVKEGARGAIKALRQEKIDHIAMLTGDNQCAAEAVARHLDLDLFYAELLPEEKVVRLEEIEAERRQYGKIAFVGDGINDAPVIARADVGVAMGGLGSDAAIETADVVLMTDSLDKMARAVNIARQTRRIVWQNIGLAFFIKIFFIVLGAMGLASMWGAVFADMGTALLAVFNSTRILRV